MVWKAIVIVLLGLMVLGCALCAYLLTLPMSLGEFVFCLLASIMTWGWTALTAWMVYEGWEIL